MLSRDFELAVEEYHRAVNAFITGDPGPQESIFSRSDDVTLANPLGPPVHGWNEVDAALKRASSQLRAGEPIKVARVSALATDDLGYLVELQRTRAKIEGSEEMRPIALRVTTVLRKEDGEWRVLHRHADPITTPRSADSVVDQSSSAEEQAA